MKPLFVADIVNQMVGDQRHPVQLATWNRSQGRASICLPKKMTHFGFSLEGSLKIDTPSLEATLKEGGFFRLASEVEIEGDFGFVLSVDGDQGLSQITNHNSSMKFVKYKAGGIENCLIWPSFIAQPTLNILHMKRNVSQKNHHHTSPRINIVIDGSAFCHLGKKTIELSKGSVVLVKTNEHHDFFTKDESMTFVAFHPDSEPAIFNNMPMELQTYGSDMI